MISLQKPRVAITAHKNSTAQHGMGCTRRRVLQLTLHSYLASEAFAQ